MRLAAGALAGCVSLAGCRRGEDLPAPPSPERGSADLRAAPARERPPLRDLLTAASRRALDESTVTLLVPAEPAALATAVITSGPQWAAVSIARGDHTVTIHATSAPAPRAVPAPRAGSRPRAAEPAEPAPTDRVRGVAATLSSAEGVRAATWTERGVTYSLDLACAVRDDPRCARDRYLRELASSLVPLEGLR